MAPLRIRHPQGSSTIQVDYDNFTVLDLQQEIYAVTGIQPSSQDLKCGRPIRSLTLVPELPLESLGIKGELLTVAQKPGSTSTPQPAPASSPFPSSQGTASRPPPTKKSSSSNKGPDYVETPDGSYLIHRIVPDDNSCLFSSIALVFTQDISNAQSIRKVVADAIRSDPSTWTDVILGRSRDDYIATILKPSSWGGAIELAILANHYSTEIASIDVETGRIDRFTPPPEKDTGNRCILVYSGIHYDAATVAPMLDAPAEFHQTLVPVLGQDEMSDHILEAAKKLADKLRAKRAFTNTATFDLKCEICGTGLKGEKDARAHAKETGHTSFGEY